MYVSVLFLPHTVLEIWGPGKAMRISEVFDKVNRVEISIRVCRLQTYYSSHPSPPFILPALLPPGPGLFSPALPKLSEGSI